MTKNNLKIGVISLGCDKNTVDTEYMLAILQGKGATIVNDENDADIIIINTCAFIDDAKKESINEIFRAAQLKKTGLLQKLIITGCLPQRYFEEIKSEIPEIDGFIGTANYSKIWDVIKSEKPLYITNDKDDRENLKERYLTTQNYAYLKIADGCYNKCTYCAIPSIKGKYRSVESDNLIYQAQKIADEGIREIILVAQNTADYGIDFGTGRMLIPLLDKLSKIDFKRIRLLYLYPESVDKKLIKYISENPKICKYMDIPMQHINDRILKLMGRRTTGDKIRKLIDDIRNINENIAIRSTFITGFPQESEKEFTELKNFLKEYKLDYCGFFKYSKEDGTVAAELEGQISSITKDRRLKELLSIQSSLMPELKKKFIGKTYDVVYEGIDYSKQKFLGRTEFMAPDIDGKVIFTADTLMRIGDYYKVKINGFVKNDLKGEVVL